MKAESINNVLPLYSSYSNKNNDLKGQSNKLMEVNKLQDIKNNDRAILKAVEKANKELELDERRLEFSIHDKTKQIIVKVIDTKDDKIIREIPSEKILDMVATLCEAAGLFVDEKR